MEQDDTQRKRERQKQIQQKVGWFVIGFFSGAIVVVLLVTFVLLPFLEKSIP